MRSPLPSFLTLGFMLCSLAACVPRLPVIERPPAPTADQWTAKLLDRALHWQSYQAKLNIRADSSKGKFRFQTVVLAKLPDRFRLETVNPWGQTVALLLLRGDKALLWVPSEKTLYTAQRPEVLVAHFLGIPVHLETLGYGLTGSIPPEMLGNLTSVPGHPRWLQYPGTPEPGRSLTWKFGFPSYALEAVDVLEASWNYTITYEPSVDLEASKFPRKIRFASPQWEMDVTVDQIAPAPPMDDSSFDPPIPSGLRVIRLS
ncbi:MAG TPA: lipoprotein insertase outer membrane protein LolB [Syntrophobacteraceae bacterium]|nr:lipoprotein insertase outer membrane protein LolB [Syntrophobacteraceae bacterium]